MGLFKDMRNMQKQGKELQKQAMEMVPPEHRGVRGGFRAMQDGLAQANATLGSMHADAAKAQNLMANGRQGTATIKAVRQTGMFVNENPQVEMELEVKVDGLAPYTATARQVIDQIAIPQFQPGASVPVRVDVHDPQSLLIA